MSRSQRQPIRVYLQQADKTARVQLQKLVYDSVSTILITLRRTIMIEFLKQTVLSTMGLASLTKDKLEELATEMARLGNLSEQERIKLQNDLAARGEESRTRLNAEIDRRIDHALIQMGIVKGSLRRIGEEAISDVQSTADATMDEMLSRLKVARLEDIEAISRRLDLLEKKLTCD
jgi:polyhydroxyalkanoate synthesis regulator phasin